MTSGKKKYIEINKIASPQDSFIIHATKLRQDFCINYMYTMRYNEYSTSYDSAQDVHNCWEMIYVDKGKITISMDQEEFVMSAGDLAFHKPGEQHSLKSFDHTAPSIVVIIFECEARYMHVFEKCLVSLDESEKQLIASAIEEWHLSFDTPGIDETQLFAVNKRSEAPLFSTQIIKMALEWLLISLYRRLGGLRRKRPALKKSRSNREKLIWHQINQYIEEHIASHITVGQLSSAFGTNPTMMQEIFKHYSGKPVKAYLSSLKVNAAKRMIREGNLNYTQIAEALGFSSVHHFSAAFRQHAGRSPSEYDKSVVR